MLSFNVRQVSKSNIFLYIFRARIRRNQIFCSPGTWGLPMGFHSWGSESLSVTVICLKEPLRVKADVAGSKDIVTPHSLSLFCLRSRQAAKAQPTAWLSLSPCWVEGTQVIHWVLMTGYKYYTCSHIITILEVKESYLLSFLLSTKAHLDIRCSNRPCQMRYMHTHITKTEVFINTILFSSQRWEHLLLQEDDLIEILVNSK